MSAESDEFLKLLTVDLGLPHDIAVCFISGGLRTVEELAYVPFSELLTIPGINEEVATVSRNTARAWVIRGDSF